MYANDAVEDSSKILILLVIFGGVPTIRAVKKRLLMM
jgi:hypothetical protein